MKGIKLTEEAIQQKTGRDVNDSINLGVAYLNLGNALSEDGQKDLAKNYFLSSRYYIQGYRAGMAYFYKEMTNILLNENKDKAAINYNDSLLNYDTANRKEFADILLESNTNLTEFYLNKKDTTLARYYYEIAKHNQPIIISKLNDGYLENIFAKLLMLKQRNEEALICLESVKDKAKDWLPERYSQYIKSIAECYNLTGNYKMANKYYQTYLPLKDSLSNEKAKQNLIMAEAKYQNETKQNKIEQQNITIEYAKKQRVWLILGLCSTLFIIGLLFFIYQDKRQTAFKLNQQNDTLSDLNEQLNDANEIKSKLLGIISHDLRSPIYQLYQFLKLKHSDFYNKVSDKVKIELELETYNAASILLDNIDDLLIWSKSQMQSFEPDKQPVALSSVVNKSLDLLDLQIKSKHLHIEKQIDAYNVITTDFNFLLAIIRNLLQNAVHASPLNGTIAITFSKAMPSNNTPAQLKIINGGDVFTQQDYLNAVSNSKTFNVLISGLGFQIVSELSQKIGAAVLFQVQDDNKTCCTITLHDLLS